MLDHIIVSIKNQLHTHQNTDRIGLVVADNKEDIEEIKRLLTEEGLEFEKKIMFLTKKQKEKMKAHTFPWVVISHREFVELMFLARSRVRV